MKSVIIVVAAVAVAAWLPVEASSYRELSERWVEDRDELLIGLTRDWLDDPEIENLESRFMRLMALEVRLANQPDVHLYTPSAEGVTDVREAVRRVVHAYLKELGWEDDTGAFFEDETFEVLSIREE